MQGVGGNWSCLASKMLLLKNTNKRIDNIKAYKPTIRC